MLGTRYRYKYRYEVRTRYRYEVQVQVQVQVRGTSTRYKYTGTGFLRVTAGSKRFNAGYACTLNACTLGTRGNTKEGTGTGTKYMYRSRYGLDKQVWVYKSVVRQKLVKTLSFIRIQVPNRES
jgi:hypothetical protein